MRYGAKWRRAVATLVAGLVVGACSDDPAGVTGLESGAKAGVSFDNSAGTAVSLSAKAVTLVHGTGILLRAQLTEADGRPNTTIRPTWRSTNSAVATATPLADSVPSEGINRAAISSIGAGTALIIASFGDVADTARVTVVARTDSSYTPPPRAVKFDLIVRTMGLHVPGDTMTRVVQALPGSRVTLTLLPLAAGDSVPAGVPRVTTPTVVGTMTADTSGVVRFIGVTVSRYRIDVQPPAGTTWTAGSVVYGPPYYGMIYNEMLLRRP